MKGDEGKKISFLFKVLIFRTILVHTNLLSLTGNKQYDSTSAMHDKSNFY